jgi:hypothetical protein
MRHVHFRFEHGHNFCAVFILRIGRRSLFLAPKTVQGVIDFRPAQVKMTDLHDRYPGCLLGLATGDALGTTLEFSPPGSFTPIEDMVGGGPFDSSGASDWPSVN